MEITGPGAVTLNEASVSPSLVGMGTVPAYELKYVITEQLAADVEAWAQRHTAFDSHAIAALDNAYRIHSLYLDTPRLDTYYRAPSYARRKFRLRRYGDDPGVYLERKAKNGDRVSKRRTLITDGDLARLREPLVDLAWEGYWFHRRVITRQFRPTCQLSYERTAHVSVSPEGPVRLTMDRHVHCMPVSDWVVGEPHGTVLLLPGYVILELKYRTALPLLFKRLVDEFKLTPERGSKYRMSVEAWRLHQPVKEAS